MAFSQWLHRTACGEVQRADHHGVCSQLTTTTKVDLCSQFAFVSLRCQNTPKIGTLGGGWIAASKSCQLVSLIRLERTTVTRQAPGKLPSWLTAICSAVAVRRKRDDISRRSSATISHVPIGGEQSNHDGLVEQSHDAAIEHHRNHTAPPSTQTLRPRAAPVSWLQMTFITLNKRKKSPLGTHSSFQSLVSSCFRHRQLARAAQRSPRPLSSVAAQSSRVCESFFQLGPCSSSSIRRCGGQRCERMRELGTPVTSSRWRPARLVIHHLFPRGSTAQRQTSGFWCFDF